MLTIEKPYGTNNEKENELTPFFRSLIFFTGEFSAQTSDFTHSSREKRRGILFFFGKKYIFFLFFRRNNIESHEEIRLVNWKLYWESQFMRNTRNNFWCPGSIFLVLFNTTIIRRPSCSIDFLFFFVLINKIYQHNNIYYNDTHTHTVWTKKHNIAESVFNCVDACDVSLNLFFFFDLSINIGKRKANLSIEFKFFLYIYSTRFNNLIKCNTISFVIFSIITFDAECII